MLIRGEIIKHVAKIDICHSPKETTCDIPPKPVVMTTDARVPRWLSSPIRGATVSGGGDDGQIQGSGQACDVA
jgi:hypothetical protein